MQAVSLPLLPFLIIVQCLHFDGVGLHAACRHFTTFIVMKVPIPASTASMKVATTVFVGNISERASDTLIRQILLVSQVNVGVFVER